MSAPRMSCSIGEPRSKRQLFRRQNNVHHVQEFLRRDPKSFTEVCPSACESWNLASAPANSSGELSIVVFTHLCQSEPGRSSYGFLTLWISRVCALMDECCLPTQSQSLLDGKRMRIRRMLGTAAVVAAMVIVPVTAAQATTEKVGGGVWTYGVSGGIVSSDYHHPTKYHTATACNNGLIDKCQQVSAAPDAWARASKTASWAGGNTAFWNVL